MADLQALYKEFGPSGLIPYALTAGSKGQRLLIDKIKEGDALFFLESPFHVPFLRIYDGKYHMLAYTDEKEAEAAQEAARRERYDTIIQTVPNSEREDFFKKAFSSGAEAVRIDDALSIPTGLLAEVPTYDGRPTPEHILLNRELNAAVFYYFQVAYAQKNNAAAEKRWAELMFHSELLIAVEDDAANDYPFIIGSVGKAPCFYIFSDWNEAGKVFPGKLPACVVVTLDELEDVLTQFPGYKLLYNKGSCHCAMDSVMLQTIRTIVNSAGFVSEAPIAAPQTGKGSIPAVAAISHVSEDDWDSADPTPDWLK